MPDKRKFIRWQLNKLIKIQLQGAVASAECLLKDISFSGMQISLRIKLPLDKFIKLRIILFKGTEINVEAWVARHKFSDGRNIYGLYFTKIDSLDKGKIYGFVYKNMPQGASKGGGEKMDDRRIFQRFNIRFPVRLLDLNNGEEIVAETSDVSAKGIGLWSKKAIIENTPVEAWLKIPDRGEPLYTRGNVAWSRTEGLGECHLGINLEKADLMGLSRILRS